MLDLAECITIADGACDILLNRLGNEPEMKGRSGGFLCIADKKGQVLLLTQIGDVPEEMLGRYSRNAVEKAQRLAWTSQYAGHTLSRQSRDEARERWIGAVAVEDYIFSFSGHFEDSDELLSLVTARDIGDLSTETAVQYAAGRNKYFPKVKDIFFRGVPVPERSAET